MTEHRCIGCKGLLLKGDHVDAEIVCHRCKTMNRIKHYSQKSLIFEKPTIDKGNS